MTEFINTITQDFNESDALFHQRTLLTVTLYEKNQLNPITAITCGRLLMNKIVLGVVYDVEIENLLTTLDK
jgi:hypothetical protein